jgi:hypothetical protein
MIKAMRALTCYAAAGIEDTGRATRSKVLGEFITATLLERHSLDFIECDGIISTIVEARRTGGFMTSHLLGHFKFPSVLQIYSDPRRAETVAGYFGRDAGSPRAPLVLRRKEIEMKSTNQPLPLLLAVSAALVVPLVTVAQPKHRVAIKLEEVRGSAEHIVRVRAEIKNISEEPIDVMRASPSRDFTVTVVGPDKKPAALTLAAERSHSVVPNGSQILVTLPPQQSISYEWNLSDDVTLSRRFDTINEVDTSNSIEVKQP